MGPLHFFDLPVYRLSADAYYTERRAAIDKAIYNIGTPSEPQLRQLEIDNPHMNDRYRACLAQKYGDWQFNEIIGYVKLHFLGSQVRGEYYAVRKKRIVRTRTRTFEFIAWKLAPEVDIERPYGTREVLAAIQQYIEDCRAEVPRRFIDTKNFYALAPHVDWGALYRSTRQ